MNNNKRTKSKGRKLRNFPYYLGHSFNNLFNRASEEFCDTPQFSGQSNNLYSEENIPRLDIQSNCSNSENSGSVNSNSFKDSIVLENKDMTEANGAQSAAAAATAAAAAGANLAVTATQVFNCLKIPDAVKDLPKFDGNPRLLHDFIDNVEEILSLVSIVDGTLYSAILLRAIRNKIEGPANEVLNMYGTPLEWEHIKKNLILHYSDKRNETSLIRDLHSLRQFNKPVEKYYSEIIELQATMFNHIQIHETDSNVIKAKRDLFSEMCLSTFLTGLREPLGSTIRAMQPESLPVAFSYCIKEQNIFYAKHDSYNQAKSKQKPSRPINQQQPMNFPSPRQTPFQSPQYRYISNQQPRPFAPNPFERPNFSKPRPFAPNPFDRPNLPKPEPMDTSSGNTHLRQQTRYQPPRFNSNFNQPNQQPRFVSKELFNIDEGNSHRNTNDDNIYPNDNYYTNLDRYYNDREYSHPNHETNHPRENEAIYSQNFEIDDTNFHIAGPMNPSDT